MEKCRVLLSFLPLEPSDSSCRRVPLLAAWEKAAARTQFGELIRQEHL
jgi:hypothetical protein